MNLIRYQGRSFHSRDDETLLEALLRQGISIPFSCKSGVCHVCMQRCVQGAVPVLAQHGLRQELVEQNCFLACQCIPTSEMEIEPPSGLFSTTMVAGKEMLAHHVAKVLIEPPANFEYQAGQFINVRRKDGIVRSYSLASLPGDDYFLEIQVQRKSQGVLSNWILDELNIGDELDISGPFGECHYLDNSVEQPLLMIATGTGLSPLFGIVRTALQRRHRGEIYLYHGGRSEDRFYLRDTLRQLEKQHANFHYVECISAGTEIIPNTISGRANDVAFSRHPQLGGWHVYLAGLAEMVDSAEQLAQERSGGRVTVHADPFVFRELRVTPRNSAHQSADDSERLKYPPPDPELWLALKNGEMLMEVLQDFYRQVFEDAKLSRFFDGVTRQRSIEKQYLFMRQILTGEKIYFGERPRNAHHWMVISNELFDYRSNIMMTCLREHGLAEDMVQRFHDVEEFYRGDIVKTAPFARTMGDIELPLDGFNELIMDVGALCDSCEQEISVGEKVIYHVRVGKVYCRDCSKQHTHEL